MWCLGTWLSGGLGLGSVRLTVWCNDFKGLFQCKCFYDSRSKTSHVGYAEQTQPLRDCVIPQVWKQLGRMNPNSVQKSGKNRPHPQLL